MEKVEKVSKFRINSPKKRTNKWAEFPTLFSEDRQPDSEYLLFPKVSSERRKYIPLAFLPPTYIVNNTASYMPNATHYSFGILQSVMHMSWMRYVCGRMKSDFIYSNTIVYNNFPWPENPTEKQKDTVEKQRSRYWIIVPHTKTQKKAKQPALPTCTTRTPCRSIW